MQRQNADGILYYKASASENPSHYQRPRNEALSHIYGISVSLIDGWREWLRKNTNNESTLDHAPNIQVERMDEIK